MNELKSYADIRIRLGSSLQPPQDSDTAVVLEKCCLLMAALALGTEAALMIQTPAPLHEDLRTLLHHLSLLYSEELRLLRAALTHHATEIRRHGVPEDVVQAAVTQRLYHDFCGILHVPEPPPALECGPGMTPDAFLAVFPGAGWLTVPEVVARLDHQRYGGNIWAQAPLQTKLTHVPQMVRHLTETAPAQRHRHVGESAHHRDSYLQRVYKWVQEFTDADWEDVVRYHERMVRYYREHSIDLLPLLIEYHPERFDRLDLRI